MRAGNIGPLSSEASATTSGAPADTTAPSVLLQVQHRVHHYQLELLRFKVLHQIIQVEAE